MFHSKNAFTGNASYKKSRTSATVQITPQKTKRQASVLPAICKAFGPTFLFGVLLKFIQDVMTFVSPQLLRLIINFVDDSINGGPVAVNGTLGNETEPVDYAAATSTRDPLWRGILYAVLLFVVASTQTLFLAQYFQRMFLVGLRVRTALVGAIYNKVTLSEFFDFSSNEIHFLFPT